MEPTINLQKLFQINKGRTWPVIPRGNVNRVQKILRPNFVHGLPTHWPKLYYGQTRENLALNRTFSNTNVRTLPDGVYLYLIEYDFTKNRYHTKFVRVLNLLEGGSRHFQLPSRNSNRIVLVAGELSKMGPDVIFNLESGTYSLNLMKITKNYVNKNAYVSIVKNVLGRNAQYQNGTLIPKLPGSLGNLLTCGNVSFYYGEPSNATKARIQKNLKAAGLVTNSAKNLIRQLMGLGENLCVGSARQSPVKKSPPKNKNGGASATQRPRRRTAGKS